jgi:DedD protein
MPRYFEEDDRELDEPQRDTEVTLSWGALLGMGLGLLAICAVFFGLGYAVGHRSPNPSAAASAASQPNAADQEPLQGSRSVPKPSANAQAVVTPPPNNTAPAATENSAVPGTAVPASSSLAQSNAAQNTPPGAAPPMRPALSGNAPEPARTNAMGAFVQPALPSANSLMVQVAAVKNEEDAIVLTNALRRRGYPVTSHRDPADGLIHVRIGPFPTRDEANQWRMRLLNDGYNAIVQP